MLYITRVKKIEGIKNTWKWDPKHDGPIALYKRNPAFKVWNKWESSEGPRIDSAGLKREGPNSSASEPTIQVLNPRPREVYIIQGRTGKELFELYLQEEAKKYNSCPEQDPPRGPEGN